MDDKNLTLEQQVEAIKREGAAVRHVFMSGAGEILALPDDATKEEILNVLKRFARRIMSIGKPNQGG